jgi:hypothetical protein
MNYSEFLQTKEFKNTLSGFKLLWMPDFLFGFQKELVEWSVRRGKAALFADCGLGKTPMQLVWAENVRRKTNKRVLIVTPLSVSHQTLREAKKFGIEAGRSNDGKPRKGITITNYERLERFNPKDYVGFVADESGILKNFDGKTRRLITEFVNVISYRLLCTATPAPNDFMELGTSAEALGMMTYNQMLAMFFTHMGDTTSQWTLKAHAKRRFWEWVSTWARAIRRPSDLGYSDGKFKLPALIHERCIVKSPLSRGSLIVRPAVTMEEQRAERKASMEARCEEVMRLVAQRPKEPWVVWCHLNPEGDLLEKIIPGSMQVSGSMPDEEKEARFVSFVDGEFPVLITKPKIGGFGMNWQHCPNVAYFPDDSYEKFYQCVRRCWRFGQKREVHCHIVSSERQSRIVKNMMRKERQANEMYSGIIKNMAAFQTGKKPQGDNKMQKVKVPDWL